MALDEVALAIPERCKWQEVERIAWREQQTRGLRQWAERGDQQLVAALEQGLRLGDPLINVARPVYDRLGQDVLKAKMKLFQHVEDRRGVGQPRRRESARAVGSD